jgi:hypothetical protein
MSESTLTMHRTAYEQRTLAVLKAVACSMGTISVGDLAFAINYQRVTRPIVDMLAVLRPLLEDGDWPPLTCLVMGSDRQPVLPDDVGMPAELRMRQRTCHTWAQAQSAERQRLRATWAETQLRGDPA